MPTVPCHVETEMTTSRLTLAALAAFSSICTLAGASAQAQTDSPRSRAAVIAEVHAARAAHRHRISPSIR
jgi:hypothetical protein